MASRTEVVCANLIRDGDGRVCLVRESKPEALGRWSLPAGRAEAGESLREAAVREAVEESGLAVEAGRLIGIYHTPRTLEGGSAVTFVFESEVVGGELGAGVERLEAAFFDRTKVAELIEAREVRGRHLSLALDSVDTGQYVSDDVVLEVPASELPRRLATEGEIRKRGVR